MQESSECLVNNACKEMAVVVSDRRVKPQQQPQLPHPTQPLKCPRCESMNTKFCYYNNYNLSQPRHFCKNCRRYWTKGGSLRNVPVGGGCRKNKRSNKTKNGGGDRNNSTEKSASKSVSSSVKCGGGSGGAANSSSSSLVNNIQDGSDKSTSIGFDSECNTKNNNSTVSCSFSSGLPQQQAIFNGDFQQVHLLNSGNSLSSISYENPQFTIDPAVISGSLNWSMTDMQWKHQQSLTSLLTDGRTPFDGSAITEPPPLLEDITSLGEAALSRFMKSAPGLSWPSLLQEEDSLSNINLNTANNNTNESSSHLHAFDWRTNNHHNEGGFLELQSDLGSWGAANWPDLSGSYAPGTSLP